MDLTAVTSQTRAQIERVQRKVAEARSRSIAAKPRVRDVRLEPGRKPVEPRRLGEEDCSLD